MADYRIRIFNYRPVRQVCTSRVWIQVTKYKIIRKALVFSGCLHEAVGMDSNYIRWKTDTTARYTHDILSGCKPTRCLIDLEWKTDLNCTYEKKIQSHTLFRT